MHRLRHVRPLEDPAQERVVGYTGETDGTNPGFLRLSRDAPTTVRVMSSEVPATKPAGGRARRLAARHWLAIVLFVLAVIFVVQNTVRHEVHFLWVTVEAATWLVLIVVFLVGVVTGLLLHRRRR